jgi:hypothetical protein
MAGKWDGRRADMRLAIPGFGFKTHESIAATAS